MLRRTVLAGGLALASTSSLRAAGGAGADDPRIALWPGAAPGGEGLNIADVTVKRRPDGPDDDIAWTSVATPVMTACPAARPTGQAVLIIPGGGYTRVAVGRNPGAVARMYAARGVTAFELLYRLPHDRWAAGPDVALQDAQRAMRLIRARAARWGIDPARVAAIGFSAGGHLVGRLGAQATAATYRPVDAADAQPASPQAVAMFFPVVKMLGPDVHAQSKRELLGADQSAARARQWSLDLTVPATMPPTFVAANADDRTVPYTNALAMFDGLQHAHIPSEVVIGEKGGHGPVLVDPAGKPHVWFDLFATFAARHGWTG